MDDGAAAFVEAADGSRSDVADLRDIAHALFSEEEDESRTTTIYWPREKCTLLKDYVEIVDTPGLDLSEEYDGWIDEHCKDADILILLVNSESALNRTERRFLEQVAHLTSHFCVCSRLEPVVVAVVWCGDVLHPASLHSHKVFR